MRPAVAFAVGLWTGGLVVGGVWLWQHQPSTAGPATPAAALTGPAAPDESARMLQENAHLQAEATRLRETVETLQQSGVTRRRVLGESTTATAASVAAGGDSSSMTTALAAGTGLPALEIRAAQNNEHAVRVLTAVVQQGQATLLRLWKNPQMSDANRAWIERQLSSQLERLVAEMELATATDDTNALALPAVAPAPAAQPEETNAPAAPVAQP